MASVWTILQGLSQSFGGESQRNSVELFVYFLELGHQVLLNLHLRVRGFYFSLADFLEDFFFEEFDLKDMIQTCFDTVKSLSDEKGLELIADYEEKNLMINSDAAKMRQVVMNLIGNAIKFTDKGSIKVTVKKLAKKSMYHILIIDTGIGMTEDEQLRIFDAFVQADSSTTKNYGGTGLGLAISKSIIEMLKGKISVESRRNEGTTFILELPFSHENQEAPPPPEIEQLIDTETIPEPGRKYWDKITAENDPSKKDKLIKQLTKVCHDHQKKQKDKHSEISGRMMILII